MKRDAILAELSSLGQQIGAHGAAVCITHGRFLPCRKADGCVISEKPEDVADVAAYHRDLPLARHAGHDPALPCRPAPGAGLCYPAPAGMQLVPWREAPGTPQRGGEPG